MGFRPIDDSEIDSASSSGSIPGFRPINPEEIDQPQPQQSLYDYTMGALKGVAKAGTDVILAPADLMYRGGNALINALPFTDEVSPEGGYPTDYRDSILEYLSGGEGNKTAEAVTHIGGNIGTLVAVPSQAKNIAAKISPYISKIPGAGSIASLLGIGTEGAAQSILMDTKGDVVENAGIGSILNLLTAGAGKGLGKLWNTFVPTAGSANKGAQVLAGDIAEQLRTITPDAFTTGLTAEERATQAALALNKTARAERQAAGKLFQELPVEPVVLDDAIKNINALADQVSGPVTPGGKSSSILNYLNNLKPADEIIETAPSKILNEFGQPAIPGRSTVIPGGSAKVPLNEVQNILRDVGKVANNADGVDRMLLGKAREEIMNAAERSVSPGSMEALKDARKAWSEMAKTYDDSAVGAVRKSLLEPGKRLNTLKTKLLSDPKSAEELTKVMTPKELSNIQNLVLMDLTAKQPVTWERAISQKYDSYLHIFGEANTEKLLQMVSREGSIGSQLLKDNNGLRGLLASTAIISTLGAALGYQATGDWKGSALGAALVSGKGRLEGKIVNQAKSLLMRAAIGSPEALKILNTVPKGGSGYKQAIEKLAAPLAAGLQREFNLLPETQSSQKQKQSSAASFNSTLDKALTQAEKQIAMDKPKPVEIIEAKRTSSKVPSDSFIEKEEGGQKLAGYVPRVKGSGLTIGTGVDLGQHSEKDLEEMGVSDKTIYKVRKYLGKKDAIARAALKEKPLELTKEEADELDAAVHGDIYGTVEDKLKAKGVTLAKLPEEAQTVIKSIAINFGKNFDEKIPSIWKAITEKDWSKVQDLLVNTKWKQPELVARRKREADLLSRIV